MNKTRFMEDFEVVDFIGSGSYGNVFKIQECKTGRVYAAKVLRKKQYYEEGRLCFVLEEKEVFRVSVSHPFLVTLLYCFQTPNYAVFVTHYVDGDNMKNVIVDLKNAGRRLPEENVRFYTAEIALALSFLHSNSIVYRDLKLSNIMLAREGHVILLDYGYCKTGVKWCDRTYTQIGSPLHVAPEIIINEAGYNQSVDWWAFGVLAFEMFTGYNPFCMKAIDYYKMREQKPPEKDMEETAEAILHGLVQFPEYVTGEAKRLIRELLVKEPTLRLGCRSKNAFEDLKSHPFYESIDWDLLIQKKLAVPSKVTLHNSGSKVDQLSKMSQSDIFLHDSEVIDIEQKLFENFDWLNPEFVSSDFH